MQKSFEQLIEILEQLELVCKGGLSLPAIEKDIALEKMRNIYELLQMNQAPKTTDNAPVKGQNYEVYQGIEEDVDLFFDTDHESYSAIHDPSEREVALKMGQEKQKRLAEEQRRKEEEQKRNQPSDEDDLLQFMPKEPSPSRFQATPKRSLNDLFQQQGEDHSLGAQFQNAKVSDLTKAISINDKFTYIKELFNNKGEEFSAAITSLNQCRNMEEAFNTLETLKQKYYWDSTSTTYLSLCDLLRRKFN